jgi:hypothetical protein
VPFTASNQGAFFQIAFGTLDLSDTVATFRLSASLLDGTGQLFLQPFATDNSGFTLGAGTFTLINTTTFGDTATFVDIALDVGAITSAGFDDTDVIALGIQVGTGGALVAPINAALLLDSITYGEPQDAGSGDAGSADAGPADAGSGPLPNLTFTDDAQGFAVNQFAGLQTATVTHH